MRRLLTLAGLSALTLPLAMLACTPVVRPDPIGSGGSGGSGGTAAMGSTTSGTAATGTGGGGGSIPMGTCGKAGQAFTILGDQELVESPKLSDKIYLVPDAGKRSMVHVIIADTGTNRLYVRSLIDDPTTPLGNYAQYGDVASPTFRPASARITPGQLHIQGTDGNYAAELNYVLDPDKGVEPGGGVQDLPTPIECLQGGHAGKIVFAPGITPPEYLLTCIEDPPGATGRLFAADGTSNPVELVAKAPDSPAMQPVLYTQESGTHLVIFGGDKGGSFFSQSTDATLLGALQPLKLTPAAVALEGVFATVPLPAHDGVTLITAYFDTAVGKGKFLAGPVLTKDYATLAKIPAGNIAPIQDISMLIDVAPIFFPTWDATGIFGGGASSDGTSAQFFWFTRDGKPLVFGQTIYQSPGPTIIAANAAPLGDPNKIIVWIERDDSFNPPKYTVKGQKLICQIKS